MECGIMAVIYFKLLLGLHSQKLIIFMDNFRTEFYSNLMENAENRAKFHLKYYVIITPTSQIVIQLSIYQQNYLQVLHMRFHPNNSRSMENSEKSLGFTSSTISAEAIFTKIIITLQHVVKKSYMEFHENMINCLVVDAVTFFFLKNS